eukprot:TRINITY_DN27772_c0_g3_i1.p1 TRINITY_DN27772_c0_g3~~TRINITY_DN27772_c0_g3_i1.p1  ORF type:complete len:512 (-),score=74.79 TRINITY_DN27772_c0_g3_i1:63-1598(-)
MVIVKNVLFCLSLASFFKSLNAARSVSEVQDGDMPEEAHFKWLAAQPGHEDSAACLWWSFGHNDATATDDDRFGCISALVRSALLQMLDSAPESRPISLEKNVSSDDNTTCGTNRYSSRVCSQWDTLVGRLAPEWLKRRGEKPIAYVRSFESDRFAQLRQIWNMNIALRATLQQGRMKSLNPGAGKSGSGFALFAGGGFVMKMGLKAGGNLWDGYMDEPGRLLDLMVGDYSMVDHFIQKQDSLLNKIAACVEVAFGNFHTYAIVLENSFYGMDSFAQQYGFAFNKYDLKGISRDPDEKSKPGSSTLLNGNFTEREVGNRMQLLGKQCKKMRAVVKDDIEFLETRGLIDYSMALLSVRKSDRSALCSYSTYPTEPLCVEHRTHLYTLSIIDYLNNLNWGKTVESFFRKGKFVKYGLKFEVLARKLCRTRAERRLHDAVSRQILKTSLQEAFSEIDSDGSGYVDKEEILTFLHKLDLSDRQRKSVSNDMVYDGGPNGDKGEVMSFTAFKWLFS